MSWASLRLTEASLERHGSFVLMTVSCNQSYLARKEKQEVRVSCYMTCTFSLSEQEEFLF